MIDNEYKKGAQPCKNFEPTWLNTFGEAREHDCHQCQESTLSFCKNCYKDHHKGGYEACCDLQREAL